MKEKNRKRSKLKRRKRSVVNKEKNRKRSKLKRRKKKCSEGREE